MYSDYTIRRYNRLLGFIGAYVSASYKNMCVAPRASAAIKYAGVFEFYLYEKFIQLVMIITTSSQRGKLEYGAFFHGVPVLYINVPFPVHV